MNKEINVDYSEGEGLELIKIKGTVTLKRLNFSEKNALEEESTDIKMIGDTPHVKISTSKMKEVALAKSIVSASLYKTTMVMDKESKQLKEVTSAYPLNTMQLVRELPQEIGETLFYEWGLLNSLGLKKKEN